MSDLIADCDKILADTRAELDRFRPRLVELRDIYSAHIEHLHSILFVASPPLPNGSHVNLPPLVERECEEAVIAVLERHLAKVCKAMGDKA